MTAKRWVRKPNLHNDRHKELSALVPYILKPSIMNLLTYRLYSFSLINQYEILPITTRFLAPVQQGKLFGIP